MAVPLYKKITLPGFQNVPLYKVLAIFIKELFSPKLILRAKAIAFSFFLALFPTIVFLFSLIAYIPIDNFSNDIIGYFKNVMPNKNMVNMFVPMINDIMVRPKAGVLSVGFLLIIFFMNNGVITMIQSFNMQFENEKKRNFFLNHVVSIGITFVILLLFLFTIIFVVLGKTIMTFIFHFFDYDNQVLETIIDILRFGISIALDFLVISILYYYGPSVHNMRFKFVSPGSIFATILIVSVSILFSDYIKHFGSYNRLYGSLGTILLTLIWLYWNSMAILIGFELNRSIYSLKKSSSSTKK
jgi:membrane protein